MAPTKKKIDPVIPIKADYDESLVEYIKHRRSESNNNVTEEISERVPILPDDATAHRIVTFLAAFNQARRHMQWTTGPKLFQRFELHLQGTHLLTWQDQTFGANQTVAIFNGHLELFKDSLLAGYDYEEQKDYLRSIRKTADQTPSQFYLKFLAAETHARLLPDAPDDEPVFSEEERKRLFLRAMPIDWQKQFDAANLQIATETIADMRKYFDLTQRNNPLIRNNDNNGGNNNNDNRNNGNGNGNGNRGRRNRRGNRNNGGRNNNNSSNESSSTRNNNTNNSNTNDRPRLRPDDTCPLPGHGNHKWIDCYQNINNPNARPSRSRNNQGNNNRESNATESSNNNSNNSSSNNSSNNSNSNGSNNSSDNYYFCLECDTDQDPESFLFDQDYQTEFEPELYDPEEPEGPQDSPRAVDDDVDQSLLAPSTLAIARKLNDSHGRFLFKSLLDHGGSHVLVNRRALPKDVELFPLSTGQGFNTAAGGLSTTHYVYLHDLILPEFSYTRRVSTIKAFVFNNDSVFYDVIFGRSFLNSTGIDVCSSDLSCRWLDNKIPFHTPDFFKDSDRLRHLLRIDPVRIESFAANRVQVKPTVDTTASVEDVVANQAHLTEEQRSQLLELLKKHSQLFDGTLGCYPKRKFHIELKEDAVPYHCKAPYPVPSYNLPVLKQELDRQVDLGILEKCQETEWGMPLLVIPKKDGAIRTVDDFRELNRQIKRKQYPLPKIQDIFHRRQGYKFFTKLDLTLCYYNYELDEESSWLCVLVTPLGKYRRKRAPMGCCQSSDWAQGAIESALDDHNLLRDCVEAYIDDVGCFSNSWDEHLAHLDRTFACLVEHGYRINPAKCEWAVEETDWLGHWMTPKGIKPWDKKVQGILAVARPTTVTQLRSFIGMINFYRDAWKKRAEILAPLSKLTKSPKNRPLPWPDEAEQAFLQIKALIAKEVLLYYPDPNKEFIIDPDASKVQLGSTIYQEHDGKLRPVAFFSRKLTPAQTRYPASDLEALCITETFEEFRPILYGSKIRVRSDHANLSARTFRSHRLLHWRLLLEEFAPIIEYQRGSDNVVADALSRLPLEALPEEKKGHDSIESMLAECFLYYPEDVDSFPVNFENIAQLQQQDQDLLPLADRDDFQIQVFNGQELISHRVRGQWRIVLPQAIIKDTISWYHSVLGHCGETRLAASLRKHFWFPDLLDKIKAFVSTCDQCQRNKLPGPGYGHLPPRNDTAQLWEEVAVDLIGPWKIELPMGTLIVKALTIIDTTSTLSEATRVENATSGHTAMQFENTWLSRYPRPLRVIHDQGSEFVGAAFQNMLLTNGIRPVPISTKNPQANSVCERIHQTVQEMLATILRKDPAPNIETAYDHIDSCLAAATRAVRSAIHRTLQVSPGALVFHRDMMLPVPIEADYNLIRARRQAVIDDNNRRANLRRRFFDYSIGDQVLLILPKTSKLREKTSGPYRVTQVHINGTVTVERLPNVFERINIRRLKPYFSRDQP